MSNQLTKKYGLVTAICTVVGTVIGSGVFFKAEKILTETGGNLPVGILAWIIGGIVMVACAYAFSILATKHEKVSGIVDYAEAMCGKKYAYFVGWFLAVFYYPTLTSVLAWVSSRYLCVLLGDSVGWGITGPQCMTIAGVILIAMFTMNTLAPKLAGKFQVSATFIKLIPLFLMAIIGTVKGLSGDQLLIENFKTVVDESIPVSSGLFKAVVATAFAYEGWICATAINAELKDAKKNLPRALVIGTLIIVAVYIIYYVGLAGGITNEAMMQGGEQGAKDAFGAVFGKLGNLLFVFVVISCLGTTNGLTLGCTRAFYSIATRDLGVKPAIFKQVDPETSMPTNSSYLGLLVSSLWLLFFYGSQLDTPWFGNFSFDSSELPIITTYAMYIPIFVAMFIKSKDLSFIKGKVAPVLAIIASIFMIIAAIFAHGIAPYQKAKANGEFSLPVLFYLITFAVLMIIGAAFMRNNKKLITAVLIAIIVVIAGVLGFKFLNSSNDVTATDASATDVIAEETTAEIIIEEDTSTPITVEQ